MTGPRGSRKQPLEQERDELRAELLKRGQHGIFCTLHVRVGDDPFVCNCGWEALKAKLSTPAAPETPPDQTNQCPTCGSDDKSERLDVTDEDNIFDYPCTHLWHGAGTPRKEEA